MEDRSRGYRESFAAGGADMLAVLDAEFRHYAAGVVQRDTRSAAECLARMTTRADLRRGVDSLVTYFVLPSPHGPNDFYVVAEDVLVMLLIIAIEAYRSGRMFRESTLDFAHEKRTS